KLPRLRILLPPVGEGGRAIARLLLPLTGEGYEDLAPKGPGRSWMRAAPLPSTPFRQLDQALRRQHLRQHLARLARRVPQVERHARRAVRGEEAGDFRIA